MSSKHKQLWERLSNPDFRRQFIDAHVDEGIAFQIRSLRNKRGHNQPEFAQVLGLKQSQVSAWENPNYGSYSLNTLKKLAKAFDVGLLVRFVPFSSLIDWTVNLKPNDITPPSYNEEQSRNDWIDTINNTITNANELKPIIEIDQGINADTTLLEFNKPKSPEREPAYVA